MARKPLLYQRYNTISRKVCPGSYSKVPDWAVDGNRKGRCPFCKQVKPVNDDNTIRGHPRRQGF